MEVVEEVVGGPIGDEVVAVRIEGAAARRGLCPAGALELDDAAEATLAVGDEKRLPVRGECDATKRAKEVKDLLRFESLCVNDADVVVCFSSDKDTRAGADG